MYITFTIIIRFRCPFIVFSQLLKGVAIIQQINVGKNIIYPAYSWDILALLYMKSFPLSKNGLNIAKFIVLNIHRNQNVVVNYPNLVHP